MKDFQIGEFKTKLNLIYTFSVPDLNLKLVVAILCLINSHKEIYFNKILTKITKNFLFIHVET